MTDDSSSETLTLSYPITINGERFTTFTVRRPTAGVVLDARKMKGDDADKEMALFASLTGVAPANLRDLDMKDYAALQEVYQSFLS